MRGERGRGAAKTRRDRTRAAALLLAALAAGWAACRSAAPPLPGPRLVLLYAPCTVNRQYLAPYDPTVAYTPNLRAFAEHATVFLRHQTEAGVSGVAYASMFAGVQADRHGVFAHPKRLPDSLWLLTEAFAAAGWDVASWLAHPMATAGLGYAQGVQPEHVHKTILRAADPAFGALLDRLRDDPRYRALVVANFTVTHRPYPGTLLDAFCTAHPAECGARRDPEAFARLRAVFEEHHWALAYDFERTVARLGLSTEDAARLVAVVELLYRADVFHLDRMFGKVVGAIAARGLLPQSVVVFTADHGEVLHRDHSFFSWSHAYQLAPEVVTVPLLVHAPGGGVGAGTYEGVTRSVDVFPTLAGLAHVPLDAYDGPGVDLSAAVAGRAPVPRLRALSHSSVIPHTMVAQLADLPGLRALFPARDPRFMWVAMRQDDAFYKLRRLGGDGFVPSRHDLATDPTEATDRFDPGAAADRAAADALERYRRRLVEAYGVWEARPGELPRARRDEMLRSLGYIQ